MEKQTARLEAFSDGIFGVAITLLALEIGIKEYQHPTNLDLWHRIVEKWPEYFTFFNSFATLLLVWIGHHKMIQQLRSPNLAIFLANGFMMLVVVLFPFPTKMVGSFIYTDAKNTAVAFYVACTGMITVSMTILNLVMISNKKLLINTDTALQYLQKTLKGQFLGIIIYLIGIVAAFYEPFIALGISFFMWVFWAIITKDDYNDLT